MSLPAILLAATCLINIAFPAWRIYSLYAPIHSSRDLQNYSYNGLDHPFYHPTLFAPAASLTLQETVHYSFNTTSDPDSAKEWDQMLDSPEGTGRIHLGPNRRTFVISFYHQLHCIVELKEALVDRNTTWATPHHVNHCLQYLRQTMLCQASDKLEDGDFMARNFEADRWGPEMECYDWETVYQEVGARWLMFSEWKAETDNAT